MRRLRDNNNIFSQMPSQNYELRLRYDVQLSARAVHHQRLNLLPGP